MARILIIEDDTDINNAAAEYLRRRGCACDQAFSGTEGLRLWREGGYDLLLVDLMLPGLSGDELVEEVSGRTPIIVVSARTELSGKVALLTSGADDYLTKPYALEELWARVQVQLRHASAAPVRERLRFRAWELDLEEMTLTAAGEPHGPRVQDRGPAGGPPQAGLYQAADLRGGLAGGVRRGGQDHFRPHQQYPGQAAAQRHGRIYPDRVGHRLPAG